MRGRVDDSHIKMLLMLVVSARVRVRRSPGTKASATSLYGNHPPSPARYPPMRRPF